MKKTIINASNKIEVKDNPNFGIDILKSKSRFIKNISELVYKGYDIDLSSILWAKESKWIGESSVSCKVYKVYRYEGSCGNHIAECLNRKQAEALIDSLKENHINLYPHNDLKYKIKVDTTFINIYNARILSGEIKRPARKVV